LSRKLKTVPVKSAGEAVRKRELSGVPYMNGGPRRTNPGEKVELEKGRKQNDGVHEVWGPTIQLKRGKKKSKKRRGGKNEIEHMSLEIFYGPSFRGGKQ